jgi:flagellar hook-associated protein 1 FlgK
MTDLFSIGSSALLAYSNALATTSNNIANVNTPGYTRQRVELQSRIGGFSGDGAVGTGVEEVGIQRLFDQFVNARLYGDASGVGRESIFSAVAGRVDQLLSDSSTGLSGALSKFFSAMDAVSASPADPAARTALIGAANSLADRFNQLSSSFDGAEQEISGRMTQTVSQVNGLAQKIADLNQRIALATAQNPGQQPNELLDQREQAITELAGKVGVTTLAQDDGSINLFVAGHPLVLGSTVTQLTLAATPGDSRGRLDVYFGSGTSAVPLKGSLGGELGGLVDARSGVLDAAEGDLGRIGVALSEQFNQLQAQGIDLNGALGGNFFAALSPQTQAYGSNTGSATIAASYADVSTLSGHDYRLSFDGSNWALADLATHSSVPLSGAGTVGNPFLADGLSFVVSGSAAAGDSYLVRSTSAAAGQIQVVISDPAKIAAASPIRAQASLANTGGATTSISVADASDANLQTPATILFTSATTYTINGGPAQTFTPSSPIIANGWSLSLTGAPASGDQFQVLANGANSSDNSNARAMAALRSGGVLDGGSASLSQAYGSLVASTGSTAQQARFRADAQSAIQSSDLAQRDSISGVNLDEEAANMVRFQQAYQAAAQIIATANAAFDSLLSALRG